MAKQAKLSTDDQAYAEAEKALPLGSGVARSGRGSAAPAHLSAEQEQQAELLGKQDAAKEIERRGLKPPPVVETSMTADFSKINRPQAAAPTFPADAQAMPAYPEAQPEISRPINPEERATIRTAGYDPRTNQVVDPERYARYLAKHGQLPENVAPRVKSESGWWELKADLPKPLPCPVVKVEAADEEGAKKAYCGMFGMAYPNESVRWVVKPCPKPEVVTA